MPTSAKPKPESMQIRSLYSPEKALGTSVEARFDGLTRLARRHFGVSMALITLVDADRSGFESCSGLSLADAPHSLRFCQQAMHSDDVLVVPDTCADARFQQHPLLIDGAHIRFCAGCPLIAANGDKLGALCLFDNKARELDEDQRESLRDLARLASYSVERGQSEVQPEKGEHALRESEKRMALAIAGSGTGIWDRNIPTNEIHYSAGWKALLGYTDSEISNRIEDSYARVHPDDLAYVQTTIQAHFDQRTDSYEVEHRLRCKDGHYIWVSSRGKVVSRDSAGKPLRMIGTTTDITAMRAISEELQQSVELLTDLTNEVPGLVFQYRRLAHGAAFVPYASAGIKDIYELSPEQVAISAAAINDIIHPEDLATYRASIEASAASLTPWHLEYRVQLPRQGLRWRQGDAQPRRLEDGSTLWHGFITDVTEHKRIEAELREFATIDALTQLPNRRYFMMQIEAELARIQRDNSRPAAVLMCDLDYFKLVNDKWGHAVGDLALRHFASTLRKELRKSDIAGRIGGEEFAVVLRGADIAEAIAFARRVQQRMMATPLFQGAQPIALTLSVGIAATQATDVSAALSLSRADTALYRAKERGRNRIECY